MGKYNIENIADYIGNKYGRLTILKELPRDKNGRWVLVLCDCGKVKECRWSHVKYGKTVSCKCQAKENISLSHLTHGLSKHRLYFVRKGIIARCYNPKRESFKKYGAKGVIVCQEWLDSFEAFYNWAMENGWQSGMQIDKDIKYKEKFGISPGKIYSPEFCSVVTRKINARNTVTNVFIEYNGESKTIAEWCELSGITQKQFYARRKRGWGYS